MQPEILSDLYMCFYMLAFIYGCIHTCLCTHGKEGLTYVPGEGVILFHLPFPYDIPDAGHPVSEQGKHGHEKGEDDCAVLGVAVQLLKEAQEAQKPHCFQEVDKGDLGEHGEKTTCQHPNSLSAAYFYHTVLLFQEMKF